MECFSFACFFVKQSSSFCCFRFSLTNSLVAFSCSNVMGSSLGASFCLSWSLVERNEVLILRRHQRSLKVAGNGVKIQPNEPNRQTLRKQQLCTNVRTLVRTQAEDENHLETCIVPSPLHLKIALSKLWRETVERRQGNFGKQEKIGLIEKNGDSVLGPNLLAPAEPPPEGGPVMLLSPPADATRSASSTPIARI